MKTGQLLETPFTFENNRVTYFNTKHCGNVTTSIKNVESVLRLEKEIFETLHNYGGESADFIYWVNGKCYVANYTYTGLKAIFGERTKYQF